MPTKLLNHMTKNRLNEIASYLNERRNADGISNLRSADDVELSDFGKFTKFAYELLDALDTPNRYSTALCGLAKSVVR